MLCTHENLSLKAQHICEKPGMPECVCNPRGPVRQGMKTGESPDACVPVSWSISQQIREPASNDVVAGANAHRCPLPSTCLHEHHTKVFTRTHTHSPLPPTCTQASKSEVWKEAGKPSLDSRGTCLAPALEQFVSVNSSPRPFSSELFYIFQALLLAPALEQSNLLCVQP